MRDYIDRANDEILAIGIVEHIDAVSNVAEIVSTPGLDMIIIGSGDLAMSMGLMGRSDDPAAVEAIRRLESAIEPSPVLLGGVAQTADQANAMIGRGYNALLVGFDWTLLQRGIASAISGIRAAG
jgi:4-hydroxy-2-oxoheptanedioate aldolase